MVLYEYYYSIFNDLSFCFFRIISVRNVVLERKFPKERRAIRSLDTSLTVLIVAYTTNLCLKNLQGGKGRSTHRSFLLRFATMCEKLFIIVYY